MSLRPLAPVHLSDAITATRRAVRGKLCQRTMALWVSSVVRGKKLDRFNPKAD